MPAAPQSFLTVLKIKLPVYKQLLYQRPDPLGDKWQEKCTNGYFKSSTSTDLPCLKLAWGYQCNLSKITF